MLRLLCGVWESHAVQTVYTFQCEKALNHKRAICADIRSSQMVHHYGLTQAANFDNGPEHYSANKTWYTSKSRKHHLDACNHTPTTTHLECSWTANNITSTPKHKNTTHPTVFVRRDQYWINQHQSAQPWPSHFLHWNDTPGTRDARAQVERWTLAPTQHWIRRSRKEKKIRGHFHRSTESHCGPSSRCNILTWCCVCACVC